ncbi:MAG TPA: hypothetical protein VET27_20075 [Mycobacterium sp.]|nr:hypothetical protein [Mycobacterium sp.]
MTEIQLPARRFQVRGVAPVLICFTVGVALVGCGSSDKGGGSGLSAAESSASSMATAGEETAAPIDVCSLLSSADVSALLGATVAGQSTNYGCVWENRENLESVSIEIGSPGTASNGTLPAPEPGTPDLTTPGPDGMRFLGPGSVEFAAGGRSNTVQVAVLSMLGGGAANDAAVELARKIGPQIPE